MEIPIIEYYVLENGDEKKVSPTYKEIKLMEALLRDHPTIEWGALKRQINPTTQIKLYFRVVGVKTI